MNLSKTVLSYDEVREIFYKADFFNWHKDDGLNIFKSKESNMIGNAKENFFHEFNFMHDNKQIKLSPIKFLHGKCDEFAIALARKMNYRVGIVYEVEETTGELVQLIHAYCVKDKGLDIYSIDVRGVCPDHSEIVSKEEFEYSDSCSIYDEMDVEDAVVFFENNMSDCRKEGYYDILNPEAEIIIDRFKDKFTI